MTHDFQWVVTSGNDDDLAEEHELVAALKSEARGNQFCLRVYVPTTERKTWLDERLGEYDIRASFTDDWDNFFMTGSCLSPGRALQTIAEFCVARAPFALQSALNTPFPPGFWDFDDPCRRRRGPHPSCGTDPRVRSSPW